MDYKGTWEVVDVLVDLGEGAIVDRDREAVDGDGEEGVEREREKRKEEVLRGVLSPSSGKGEVREEGRGITYASVRVFFSSLLPSSKPPPPLPPIEDVAKEETIREAKQRRRRTFTALRSFSSPPPLLSTYSHFRGASILSDPSASRREIGEESEEDWDGPSLLPLTGGRKMEKMMLTTEGIPDLLRKVREVHERCEECLVRLKGITI